MLQRIQTVWFLIAAILTAGIFTFDIYQTSDTTVGNLAIGDNFIGIILVVLSIILDLYTIFLFKNRKRQMSFAWLGILVALVLLIGLYISASNFMAAHPGVSGHYWIGLFLPLISAVFLFMGLAGVRKDEKLVKSVDRLR